MLETIWLNRSNSIDLALLVDGVPRAATDLTRWVVELRPIGGGNTISFDSNVDAALFDTTETREVAGVDVPILKLILGSEAIPEGKYISRVIGYDAAHPDGIVWGEFRTEVRS